MGLNSTGRMTTKLTFRFMLLKRAYTTSVFQQFLSQTDFRTIDIQESLTGLEIQLGK